MENDGNLQISVSMGSGDTFKVAAFLLFPEDIVTKISRLMAEASVKLGGVSTGLGFIGSPGWVLAGAAALSLVEGILSDSAKKQALQMLTEAEKLRSALPDSATFIEVREIANISKPSPQHWKASKPVKATHDLNALSASERLRFVREHKLPSFAASTHSVTISKLEQYVHSGEEFVTIWSNETGLVHLRWTEVAAYRVSGTEQISETPVGQNTFRLPELDLEPIPGRQGPFAYNGYPYFSYPDGRVDGLGSHGWYRLTSLKEYQKYVDRDFTS